MKYKCLVHKCLMSVLWAVVCLSLSSCVLTQTQVRQLGTEGVTLESDDTLPVFHDFLFDTGAVYSLLFNEAGISAQPKFKRWIKMKDALGNRKSVRLYQYPELRVGNFVFYHGLFSHLDIQHLPEPVVHSHFSHGIIGMDIISQANWLFDFKKHQLTTYPLDSIPFSEATNSFTYSFTHKKHPTLTLNINGCKIKVLLDTGSTAYLALRMRDIERVNKRFTSYLVYEDEAMSLLGERTKCKVYQYDKAQIDGLEVTPLFIQEAAYNHIGMGFLSQFKSVFLNFKNKQIVLYL